MKSIMRKISRIARMDRDEIGCRLKQAASRRFERIRPGCALRNCDGTELFRSFHLPDGRTAADDVDPAAAIHSHIINRTTPQFFTGARTAAPILAEKHPGYRQAVLERAQHIIEGNFDLLGYDALRFDDPAGGLRWSFDPVNNVEAPQQFWATIDYLDHGVVGDSKVTWELNRFQWGADLAAAYLLTSDERYAETFFRLFGDWCAKNPPAIGINWCSSLELAFRAMSWLWALGQFSESSAFTPGRCTAMLRQMVIHARRIKAYMSHYFAPNTHLLGEALALFQLGMMLPELDEAQQWLEAGRTVLIEQSALQIRPDGAYFEQSTYYHRYALEFYQQFIILSDLNGSRLPDSVRSVVERMTDFAMHAMMPNGSLPMIGDDDGGKALQVERCNGSDPRPVLCTGALLSKRHYFAHASGETRAETLHLLGVEAAAKFETLRSEPQAAASAAFKDTGWFFMRQGGNWLHFDCGPQGMGASGHGHADMLGIVAECHGRPLIIDPGTYVYTASKEWRDYFRGTAAHSTATIDGLDQAVPCEPFKWEQLPKPTLIQSYVSEQIELIDARHNGYARLPDPVMHRRRVVFVKPEYWIMIDDFDGAGRHDYSIAFHLDTINALIDPKSLVAATNDAKLSNCTIVPVCSVPVTADILRGSTIPIGGWKSEIYGRKSPISTVRYRLAHTGALRVAFVIYPRQAGIDTIVKAQWADVPESAALDIFIGDLCDRVVVSDRPDISPAGKGAPVSCVRSS